MARQDGRVRLQLRWHHGEAGLAHGGGGGARNEGRLGLDARQPGRGGPGALLLLDAVVLNQLGMLLLLLPDLLQLPLHHALLLRDVLQLLRVLLGKLTARFLGGALFGRQGLLGLPVGTNLFFEVFLLHLKKLLGLLQPLFILLPL